MRKGHAGGSIRVATRKRRGDIVRWRNRKGSASAPVKLGLIIRAEVRTCLSERPYVRGGEAVEGIKIAEAKSGTLGENAIAG
jgi:hypothetical protein